ncbi:MAG: hypothetical protein AAFP26_06110 [Planctomycetota bacterium]
MHAILIAAALAPATLFAQPSPQPSPQPVPRPDPLPGEVIELVRIAQDAEREAQAQADWRARGRSVSDRAVAYLRAQQGELGGWRHNPDGPNFPAISALVLTGMLMDPRIDQRDPQVARGIDYVLGFTQPDGGIHAGVLPSYNTAICVSMLSLVRSPEAASGVRAGVAFMRGLQYHEGSTGGAEAPDFNEPVPLDHPYYGGVGYGRHGRPDLSNLSIFLQGLHDAGVSAEDPAFERALVFLRRVQMLGDVNEMDYADGSTQGGFIYATVPNAESIDAIPGQSYAGEIEETLTDGTRARRLRAYGSMSYAGFKSLLFADLPRDDPRVVGARSWAEAHYTLDENPGMGMQGLYYYFITLSRALDAFGEHEIAGRDWRADLVDRLEGLQQDDGSFAPQASRWMEDDPVLITAYAVIALRHALD